MSLSRIGIRRYRARRLANPDDVMSSVESRLLRNLTRASREFRLLEANDHVMVCLSGGKDSWAMLHLLRLVQRIVPFEFRLTAVNLDQGHPGFEQQVIVDYLEREGYTYRMLSENTHAIVVDNVPEGKAYCSLCSRLRRGILYNAAVEMGATKIALGHHRDDLIQTLLLNLFFAGKISSMPPRLQSDDGRNTVIRPLALCAEEDLILYAAEKGFPILPCDLCGSQDNLNRKKVKALIATLELENPRIKGNMLAALGNVVPGHLLDRRLLDLLGESRGVDEAFAALDGSPAPLTPAPPAH